MEYLLNASGIVIILFLFYFLLLKNETFFTSIRTYFLMGLIIPVSIPLIEIPIYVEAVSNAISTISYEEIASVSTVDETLFTWTELLMLIYAAGVLFFSLKFLLQIISLTHFIASHPLVKKGNYYYIETSKNISPFSFFNIIIYNKNEFSLDELEQIILHEKAHVIQWHSLDTILAHLLVIVLWFNPFVWLYKKAIQQNLEFLADAYALKQLKNQKLYQYTLLKTSGTNYCTAITNNFYNSLIKKRILMIHKNQSKRNNQFKYLLLIPVLFAFVMTFNTKVVAQDKNEWIAKSETVELIIDKESTDFNLEKESTLFKEKFDINLSFKGVKRNSKNEIIAIKIEAKGENLKAKFENAGSEPIKPIKISYDSENNAVSIGNLAEIHENHYSFTSDGDHKIKFKGKPNKEGNYVFISSDGKKTSWSGKKTDTIIHKNKIIIKQGNDEHVWVSKNDNDDTNLKTKIITDLEIINEDNASENVYIIKEEDGKIIEHKANNSFFISSNGNAEPLFILNGEEISKEEMDNLKPDDIKSINVLKGESATKKYGDKGKNGVVIISSDEIAINIKGESLETPIFMLDGKEISKEEMEKINPDAIESIDVLKGENATKKYGEKGANGVIEIKLKKN